MARILIVEDDQDFRTMLETMIRFEGHDVHLATNGETGLAQAQVKKPDILLTDIQMPGIDGYEFVRRVRADPALAHAYCILITGQGGQEAKLTALRAGADDFLEKPASRPEILGRVEIAQKVLGVQRMQREAEARAAALEEAPRKVLEALAGLDKAVEEAQAAISRKDAPGLVACIKGAKSAAAAIRAACTGTAAPSEGSWL
jgi:CheY-like chemotaxis protein